MQRIQLICVGKLSARFLQEGCAEYAKRLSAYCYFEVIELPEETIAEKSAGGAVIERALAREGERILAARRKGSRLAALCIEGKQLSSTQLAEYLSRCAVEGAGDVALVIGSSHGLSPQVKAAADLRLSMSAMTFPHQLARLMLTEQLYRAFGILNGSKYHK